jgi:5'-3' exonuclease
MVIVDGGFFVSRLAKHWAPKGRFTRWMQRVERGKMTYAHFLNKVRRTFFQDLNYLQMRIRDAGYGKVPVHICWDGTNGRNHRGSIYPAYKANRVPASRAEGYDASTYANRDIRDDFNNLGLDAMKLRSGFTGHYQEKLEADDLIADMVVANVDKDILLLTQDSDLHQLLRIKKDLIFHNFVDILEPKVTFPMDAYADWKAIAGDSSDNIPGIPSVGPKKAADLILKHGDIESVPDENFKSYTFFVGYQQHAADLLTNFRTENDRSLGWATRKYGKAWQNLEEGKTVVLNHDQWTKLTSADAVDETWFRCDDFTDTILGYRQIITLPSTLYRRDSNIDKGATPEEEL